jgi:hypothetical protein
LVFATTTVAQDREVPDPDARPTKTWTRTGPPGETPEHVTDAYPLSDQENKGRWMKFEPMSDEFDGEELDLNKWNRGLYWWRGGKPALFSDKNVTVSDGKLHLTMRKEYPFIDLAHEAVFRRARPGSAFSTGDFHWPSAGNQEVDCDDGGRRQSAAAGCSASRTDVRKTVPRQDDREFASLTFLAVHQNAAAMPFCDLLHDCQA